MSKEQGRENRPTRARLRDIPEPVQRMLWAKAAGRCEFDGCNQLLWKHPVTQELINISQKAHIYAYSPKGPRGNKGIPKAELNDIDNLMLVCHACHKLMDEDTDGTKYSVGLLKKWKSEHERRIETSTAVHPDRHSHVLYYGAPIGTTNFGFSFNAAAMAMFPDRYPAEDRPIELSTINSSFNNRDERFYEVEDYSLIRKFEQRVSQGVSERGIQHLSVFALAPQPLLIRLGTLLKDVLELQVHAEKVQVHSRTREPQSWEWSCRPSGFRFIPKEPTNILGPPALVLSVTDKVDEERIHDAMGQRATIWEITVPQPKHDIIRAKNQLKEFREEARRMLAAIRAAHGAQETLNVFPAMPAATAVELGRARQQNVAMTWKLWDQVMGKGFVPAVTIQSEEYNI